MAVVTIGRQAAATTMSCLVCGTGSLVEQGGFTALPRITSDCRPFASGGKLAVCSTCGAVQKFPDTQWLEEIARIYAEYAAYYQAGGDEQVILDSRTGTVRRRSDVIVEQLKANYPLPQRGRALDIGCGSGVTLQALSSVLPGWGFFGQDLDERNAERLRAIDGFERLFVCPPAGIAGQFDLITLIHSLEHFPDPGALLRTLAGKLTAGGLLLVQVCNTERNPYDLLIADHLTHFAPETLRLIASRNGFSVLSVETEWVAKELSMVARRIDAAVPAPQPNPAYAAQVGPRVRSQLAWLQAMAEDASERAAGGRFGIFGTSICATWLAGYLHEEVAFFVDEDPSRQGRQFMGRPVLAPQGVPGGSAVYLALTPEVAAKVARRLAALPVALVPPPLLSP
jgi:SAM-dependent methyltransferase